MRFERISVEPANMGGVPCIRGLRIPVATVVGMVADGMSDDEILRAYHVGRFVGDEVYDPDGSYLGEVRAGRLIRRSGGKSGRGIVFTPQARRGALAKFADQAANAALLGYEDFPKLEGS